MPKGRAPREHASRARHWVGGAQRGPMIWHGHETFVNSCCAYRVVLRRIQMRLASDLRPPENARQFSTGGLETCVLLADLRPPENVRQFSTGGLESLDPNRKRVRVT